MAKVPEQLIPKPKPRRPRRPEGISDKEWLKLRPKDVPLREWLRIGRDQVQENRQRAASVLAQEPEPWKPMDYAFDRSQIEEAMRGFPGVEQKPIDRYIPARADTSHIDSLFRSPINRSLIEQQMLRGQNQGGSTFYPSYYPLKVAMSDRYGPESFDRFAALSTGASAQNPVAMENAIASVLARVMREEGQLDPAQVSRYQQMYREQSGDPNKLFLARGHIKAANNLLSRDPRLGQRKQQKMASFYQNKQGNFVPYVIDTHEAAGNSIGTEWASYFRNQSGVNATEYGSMEDYLQAVANGLELPPATGQAGRWFGGGELTGLITPAGDFLDNLERQTAYTLAKRGEKVTPDSVRDYALAAFAGEGPPLMPWRSRTKPIPDYRQRGEADVGALAGIGGAGAAAATAGALYSGDADAASARFVSQLVETLKGAPKKQKWSADELERYLKNNGVKQQEIDYFKRQGVIGPDSAFQTDNKLSTNEWLEFFDKMQAEPEVRRFGGPPVPPPESEIARRVRERVGINSSQVNQYGIIKVGDQRFFRGPDGKLIRHEPGKPFWPEVAAAHNVDLSGKGLPDIDAMFASLPPMTEDEFLAQIGDAAPEYLAAIRRGVLEDFGSRSNNPAPLYPGYGMQTPGGRNYEEVAVGAPWAEARGGEPWRAQHFAEVPSLGFHYRTQEFPGRLRLEEVQSDAHQGRPKEAYDSPDMDVDYLYAKGSELEDKITELRKQRLARKNELYANAPPDDIPELGLDGLPMDPPNPEALRVRQEIDRQWAWERRKFDEQIQALQGQLRGYDQTLQGSSPPADIPWRTNWPERAFQMAVSDAVERGLPSIEWTPGYVQRGRNAGDWKTGYDRVYDEQIPQVARDFTRRFGGDITPPARLQQFPPRPKASDFDTAEAWYDTDASWVRPPDGAPNDDDFWRMTISPQLAERAKKGWPTFAGVPLPLMGDNPFADPMNDRDRSFDLTEEEVRGALFEGGPFTNPEVSPDDAAALAMGAAGIANSPYAAGKDMGLKEPAAGFVAGLASFVPDLLTGLSEEAAFATRNREALDAYLAGTGDLPFADRSEIPELPNVYEESMKAMGVDPMSPAAFGGALFAPATPLALAGPLKTAIREAPRIKRGVEGMVDYFRSGPRPDIVRPNEVSFTSEYVPGFSTGHMADATGKAMADQPEGFRQLYTMAQGPRVGDPDPIYSALGLDQLPWLKARGNYTNSAGKAEQNDVIVTRVKSQPGRLTDRQKEVFGFGENLRGLMTGQEASAGHKLTQVAPGEATASSVQASLPGYADPAIVEPLRSRLRERGAPYIDRGDGSFTLAPEMAGPTSPLRAASTTFNGALLAPSNRQIQAVPAAFDGIYREIPWTPASEQGTGVATQQLVEGIAQSSTPEEFWRAIESPQVRKWAGDLESTDTRIASGTGLVPRDDLQRLRVLVASGQLRSYVSRFGYWGLPALATASYLASDPGQMALREPLAEAL